MLPLCGHSADSNSQMVASLTSGEPHFITERSLVSFFAKAYVKGLVHIKSADMLLQLQRVVEHCNVFVAGGSHRRALLT